MIRALLLASSGAGAILLAAFLVLAALPVRHATAAECAGTMVRASWYGAESGSRTASGLRFTGREWLVAHRTLPFGTLLRLSYGGRSVTVPVEDRGPYVAGRTLDLSAAVARALGTMPAGVAWVCMEPAG